MATAHPPYEKTNPARVTLMKIATINGITLRYETEGTGNTPIIFINSLGTNLSIWDDVVTQLRGVQLVRYDKRGHGMSDAPPAPAEDQ